MLPKDFFSSDLKIVYSYQIKSISANKKMIKQYFLNCYPINELVAVSFSWNFRTTLSAFDAAGFQI